MLRILPLAALLALAFPWCVAAQERAAAPAIAARIAFVSTERILRDSVPAVRAQKKLEAEFEKRRQELGRMQDQLKRAQDEYAAALKGVGLVLTLSTMLHGIGVGNMLPSWVRVVCVDINPAVVTKLSDRGSAQTVGVVTDVGLFLHRLAEALR